MSDEHIRQVCIQILNEFGILNTSRITQDELLERCKFKRGSFYKRGLNNHPDIVAHRYKGGRNYIYNIEAVTILNNLIENGVKWDAKRYREYY